MKKMMISVVLAMFLLVGVSSIGHAQKGAKQASIKLTYASPMPAVHGVTSSAKAWIAEVEKRTNGRVKITFYPGGTLLKSGQMLMGVLNGATDIGFSFSGESRGRFPALEAIALPLGGPSGWVNVHVINDFYNKFKPKEFDDVHVFGLQAHGGNRTYMASKPIYKLEDWKGKVIRAQSQEVDIINALGATAYSAPMSEAYELMSKNMIDGMRAPAETLKGWGHAEIAKYVVTCREIALNNDFYLMMNKKVWNSLPPDIQQVFTEVSKEWIEVDAKIWNGYDVIGLKHFQSMGGGREIINIPPKEGAKWREVVSPMIDKYIKEKTAMGLPAADYVNYIRSRIKYWSEQPQPTDKDCAVFLEELLRKWH